MTALELPHEPLRIPIFEPIEVRVLTLLPQMKLIHWVNVDEHWNMYECVEGCEHCASTDSRSRIRKPRFLWEFSTDDGIKARWCPTALHNKIEEQKWRLGNDLFLLTTFRIWRTPPGPGVSFHFEEAR